MHLRVAYAVVDADPLTAAHHFLEARDEKNAMRCLGSSVMLTMGSGQWGVASDLIDRIRGVPADPAVAAIRARRMIEAGDLGGGAELLNVDVSTAPPDVRAVFRHTKLSLGWRTGDRDLMFATLHEIESDAETPPVMRDIFQIFVDASPLSPTPVPYATLAARMERMARTQRDAGHTYYAAISLHNAAIAFVAAGRAKDGVRLAEQALAAFDQLTFAAPERYSTYAVLANCWLELGDKQRSSEYMMLGLATGAERADVHSEFALLLAITGEPERAQQLLISSDNLGRSGLSDMQGITTAMLAQAVLLLGSAPSGALEVLARIPRERPLDVGDTLARDVLEAQALLLCGKHEEAIAHTLATTAAARARGALAAHSRLAIISAVASGNSSALGPAVSHAASVGQLSLLETANVIAGALPSLRPVPDALLESIRQWPSRWLPVLRRQLEAGPTARGQAAAELLDTFGQFEDVLRLRAYAKTYGSKGKASPSLGRALARRVAPRLEIS